MTHVFSPRPAWELHLRSSVIAGGVAREPWILIAKDGEMPALRIEWKVYRDT